MSLKAELETWAAALKAYDEEEFDKALDLFSGIADNSKILTNIGLIYATLGEHEAAVEQFIAATGLDQYLAVAYFQCGVSNFLLGRYDLALKDFDEALLYLRGNQAINYEQLGLKFKLYSAEVLFNKGLSMIYLGRTEDGLIDMQEARREKATDDHSVIDDAIRDRGEGYTVFSIPVGVLYRPSESKLKNAKTKDYMGKAKLVAASDENDAFTTFTGVTRLRQGISPSGTYVDRPDIEGANLSRSATAPPKAENVARPAFDDMPKASGGLERAKTTINVPADARERIGGLSRPRQPNNDEGPDRSAAPPAASGLARSNTTASPARQALGPTPAGSTPVRGLSVRRANPQAATRPIIAEPAAPPPPSKPARLTEFYDNYMDSYTDENPPPIPGQSSASPTGGNDRVAAWTRTHMNPSNAPTRMPSRSTPPSSYAPSSYGGGGMRRKPTRRGTVRSVNRPREYEEEEEGYVSGEYEDGPFELMRIRVKLHYRDEVRGMALSPEMPFEEFMEKITTKFSKAFDGLGLKFKDEDGGMVSLRDDSDYDLAIETAKETAKGKPEGKLEIWCTDL